jgi:hypothetical protein
MAILGVSATPTGLAAADGGDLEAALEARVAALAPDAPVAVLIHGYKFDPFSRTADDDPHRTLFAFRPEARCWKIRSWPEGLGFAAGGRETGLCIGFGWPAAEPHLPTLITEGRTGFARVYERAGAVGPRLAELLARIQALRPGRPIDLVAHSLGARVALTALGALGAAPGRVILLGAAEFDARAHEALTALRAPGAPEIYNVTARANDFYDAAFETFAPRRSWRERALGLGLADPGPGWVDIQLDRPEVTAWINARGLPLTPSRARLCHWSFYIRGGAFEVYRAILDRRPGWEAGALRAEPCFAAQEPRWSRMLPRAPRPARLLGRMRPAPRPEVDAGLGRA